MLQSIAHQSIKDIKNGITGYTPQYTLKAAIYGNIHSCDNAEASEQSKPMFRLTPQACQSDHTASD